MEYIIRPVAIADLDFLREILYQALYVPPGHPPFPRDIVLQPELAKYVANWNLDRDLGFVAAIEESRTLVGAAWLRLFASNNRGYGYINEHTPELTIAVLPEYRDRGIGTQLLTALFARAKNYYSSVSLSVSTDNPALKLYCRFGFETIDRNNTSLIMMKNL